jgi:hypothetical protein
VRILPFESLVYRFLALVAAFLAEIAFLDRARHNDLYMVLIAYIAPACVAESRGHPLADDALAVLAEDEAHATSL